MASGRVSHVKNAKCNSDELRAVLECVTGRRLYRYGAVCGVWRQGRWDHHGICTEYLATIWQYCVICTMLRPGDGTPPPFHRLVVMRASAVSLVLSCITI